MKVYTIFRIAAICTFATASPDYYWKPFDGTIPEDAFIATSDGNEHTYIGNTPVPNEVGVFVGQLYPGRKEMNVTITLGTLFRTVTEYIQILCTQSPELFEWMEVKAGSLDQIPYHIVQGGYETDYLEASYIGRIYYNNEFRTGKVGRYIPLDERHLYWLCVAEKYAQMQFCDDYEVLIYKGL